MFDFLNFNNPFVQGIYRVANMILLSILWIIFCIPIVTAGASTTALYYAVQKNIKNDRDYVWTCFWQSFKQNFKQSTLINLIFVAIAAVMLTDISIIVTLEEVGRLQGYAKIFFSVILIIMAIYAIWVFSYIARFRNTVKETLKNAFVLAVMHFPVTIMVALVGAGSLLLIWLMPITVFIMPSVSVLVMSFLLEKVYRMYMTEEDKHLEDERNLEWNSDHKGQPQ